MPDLANAPSADQQFFAHVVRMLAERLATPTDELAGTRCLSRPTLTRILGEILVSLNWAGFRDTSAATLIDQLVLGGIATPVPLDHPHGAKQRYHLYGVGLGLDAEKLHPIELLQAAVPAGIVCYFGALQIHELTTQLPTQYHIARRVGTPSPRTAAADPDYVPGLGSAAAPRLGTQMFVRQGMPYYSTRRDARWLRATQARYLNDKSRFNVTTLEQTLVDTVHRPASCGGPSVVLEAWDNASEQYDAERLAVLLREIDDPYLTRRVGYLLEMLDHPVEGALSNVLDAARLTVLNSSLDMALLFPGIPYTRIDTRWGLWVE
ncbi:MAG: type IV toxin-antitoxin system AbiEi family antitoxin [Gemmatimonadaceae bacterium]